MDTYSCPKGHQSSEADFCSECGAKIAGPPRVAGNGAASAGPAVCPDCQAPRGHDGGDFCEVCGFNFATGAHGDVAFAQASVSADAPPVQPAPAPVSVAVATATEPGWSIVAAIDPALREDGSPEAPGDTGPFTFAIDRTENLIGRRSRARGIEPEIPLDFDDAVSHRHAIVTRHEDGSLTIRDIRSSNGTKLNGKELEPLTNAPLHDGDEITVGHWTRLTVKASQ